MSPHPTSGSLSARHERSLLFTLAAVQFTHIMDFMIMMPLGSHLMRAFAIGPEKFSQLVAAYGISAAISGFIAGFFLDRMDRKKTLLMLYAGFGLTTLGCATASSFIWLLIARLGAGACGGVAGSIVVAMVGDVIPPSRRGRAMAVVAAAFPLASILGVPAGLLLVDFSGWHAPFFLLGTLSAIIWCIAYRSLPQISSVINQGRALRQMREILLHPIHLRCYLLSVALVFAGGSVIPFMAPSMVTNVGLSESQLKFIYLCGGAATLFTTQLFGRLSDRHDKLHVLAGISVFSCLSVLWVTGLGPTPLALALVASTTFFVTMSGRFAPAMSMIANAVEDRYRGGFMSVNSAVQQAASGLANLLAGLLVISDDSGRLEGYPKAGWVAVGGFIITVAMAAWVRARAPHAARNIPIPPVVEPV